MILGRSPAAPPGGSDGEHSAAANATGERSTPRGYYVLFCLALFALCVASFHLRVEHISASLPYPQHLDEFKMTESAGRILKTGDYRPREHSYPSLPKYLSALAMAVGYVLTAPDLKLQDGLRIQNIGAMSRPFYGTPAIIEKARQLFALLSVAALAASGAVAWRLAGRPGALLLAPLVLALSNFYFGMSWRYMNVDIVSTCFVALGMVAILRISPASPRRFAAVPAICAGLAAGSKYTGGLLILPVLIAVWLFVARGRRLEATAIAAATCGLSYLAVAPYSVIDLPRFLNSLAAMRRQYAGHGHAYDVAEPGLDTLLNYYVDALSRDFGGLGLALGLVGLVSIARADWRRALVFISFPAALLALFSAQETENLRNILPVFPLLAVAMAVGVFSLHRLAMRLPWIRRAKTPYRRAISAAVFLGIFAGGLHAPIGQFSGQLRVVGDSRVRAATWIQEHASAGTTVIVPEELQFDSRPLTAVGYPIRVAKFKQLATREDIESLVDEALPGKVLALVPYWCATPWRGNAERAAIRADELNEAMAQSSLLPLVEFHSGGCTWVNYPVPNNGNPAFGIAGRLPATIGRFNVRLDDGRLTVEKAPCGPSDGTARFFLHVFPKEPTDLPADRAQFGFEALGFAFWEHGALRDGRCAATLELPDYAMARVRTGQWLRGVGELWGVEMDGAGRVAAEF